MTQFCRYWKWPGGTSTHSSPRSSLQVLQFPPQLERCACEMKWNLEIAHSCMQWSVCIGDVMDWRLAWINVKADYEINNWQFEMGVFVPCSCLTAVLISLLHSLLLYSGCWLPLNSVSSSSSFLDFCYSSTLRPKPTGSCLEQTWVSLKSWNFPFICFALGQDCLKMWKYTYSSLIMRKLLEIWGFNGAWM